jgi:3-methyl-2-oxobutanoate hydroxymethyltransferase
MRTTIHQLKDMKRRGERIGMITAYDYTSARIVDEVGFPAILVGDSMSQVMLGYEDTVPLTLDESIHHTRAVVRGTTRSHIVADMPFLSYNTGWPDAVRNAGRYLKEAGAQSVKVEGGVHMVSTIRKLIAAGIPVMGHIGLTPQSVNQLGGYKVQGKSPLEAQRLLTDALALQEAGVYSVVLELVPAEVARDRFCTMYWGCSRSSFPSTRGATRTWPTTCALRWGRTFPTLRTAVSQATPRVHTCPRTSWRR